jgi:hypothetical protein
MDIEGRVEVGTWRDQQGGIGITLRLSDATSGETLFKAEIDPTTWWSLLTGGSQRIQGQVSNRLDRVGREMVVRTVAVPREVSGWGRERRAEALAWLGPQAQPGEDLEVRETNQGWQGIFRSWPDPACARASDAP